MGALPQDWALPTLTPWNEAWFTTGALIVQRSRFTDLMAGVVTVFDAEKWYTSVPPH